MVSGDHLATIVVPASGSVTNVSATCRELGAPAYEHFRDGKFVSDADLMAAIDAARCRHPVAITEKASRLDLIETCDGVGTTAR